MIRQDKRDRNLNELTHEVELFTEDAGAISELDLTADVGVPGDVSFKRQLLRPTDGDQ